MSRSYGSRAAAGVAAIAFALSSAAAAPLHPHSVVGTLQKVDGQTITVQTSKGLETLTLVSGTKVHVGSKTLSPSDLPSQTGSRVKVHYSESGGQKQAESVTVASAKHSDRTDHTDHSAAAAASPK
jgi:hypothetical protein